MIDRIDDQLRLPGTLITIDGPGSVGKSSVGKSSAVTRAVEVLTEAGLPVHGTRQPSRAELGELARHGTDTYHGMSLACLCAADRHHQLDTEIKSALREGRIVLCDRYVSSSLVLQGLDGVPSQIVWQLNDGVYRPDPARGHTLPRHPGRRAPGLDAHSATAACPATPRPVRPIGFFAVSSGFGHWLRDCS